VELEGQEFGGMCIRKNWELKAGLERAVIQANIISLPLLYRDLEDCEE